MLPDSNFTSSNDCVTFQNSTNFLTAFRGSKSYSQAKSITVIHCWQFLSIIATRYLVSYVGQNNDDTSIHWNSLFSPLHPFSTTLLASLMKKISFVTLNLKILINSFRILWRFLHPILIPPFMLSTLTGIANVQDGFRQTTSPYSWKSVGPNLYNFQQEVRPSSATI